MADVATDNFEQEFTLSLLKNQENVLEEIGDSLHEQLGRMFHRPHWTGE